MGTVTEPERLALRQWAGEHMDEEAAETLMNGTLPTGWADLATKSDIETLRVATKADIAALETKLDTKVEALETKIDTLGTVLAATFTAKLATEIGEVHKQLGAGRTAQTAHMITIVVAILVAMVGDTVLPYWFPPPATQAGVQAPAP